MPQEMHAVESMERFMKVTKMKISCCAEAQQDFFQNKYNTRL
jgi:hypothetical protein